MPPGGFQWLGLPFVCAPPALPVAARGQTEPLPGNLSHDPAGGREPPRRAATRPRELRTSSFSEV